MHNDKQSAASALLVSSLPWFRLYEYDAPNPPKPQTFVAISTHLISTFFLQKALDFSKFNILDNLILGLTTDISKLKSAHWQSTKISF